MILGVLCVLVTMSLSCWFVITASGCISAKSVRPKAFKISSEAEELDQVRAKAGEMRGVPVAEIFLAGYSELSEEGRRGP